MGQQIHTWLACCCNEQHVEWIAHTPDNLLWLCQGAPAGGEDGVGVERWFQRGLPGACCISTAISRFCRSGCGGWRNVAALLNMFLALLVQPGALGDDPLGCCTNTCQNARWR